MCELYSMIENQPENTDPDDLINWGELSRFLVGSRQTVRRHSIPKKHINAVDQLRQSVAQWMDKHKKKED